VIPRPGDGVCGCVRLRRAPRKNSVRQTNIEFNHTNAICQFFALIVRCVTTPRPPRPLQLAKFLRRNFHSRAKRHFPHLLQGAAVSIPTTIGRRFRHPEPKILCFVYEFFLTSFPQPPILRFQARGRISWLQLFRCPQPVVEPDRVNRKSRGALPHLTPRLGFFARLSWAFVSFFSARTAVIAARGSRCSPTVNDCVYRYGAHHITHGAQFRGRMKVLLPHGSPAHIYMAPLPARRQNG
jgi:hypothetical protein